MKTVRNTSLSSDIQLLPLIFINCAPSLSKFVHLVWFYWDYLSNSYFNQVIWWFEALEDKLVSRGKIYSIEISLSVRFLYSDTLFFSSLEKIIFLPKELSGVTSSNHSTKAFTRVPQSSLFNYVKRT